MGGRLTVGRQESVGVQGEDRERAKGGRRVTGLRMYNVGQRETRGENGENLGNKRVGGLPGKTRC